MYFMTCVRRIAARQVVQLLRRRSKQFVELYASGVRAENSALRQQTPFAAQERREALTRRSTAPVEARKACSIVCPGADGPI